MSDTAIAGTPGLGHNNPPSEFQAAFDTVKGRVEKIAEVGNRWLTERPEITDADMAGKCTDFIAQVNAALKDVEAARRAEKKPHEDAAKAVDARFRPLGDLLGKIKEMLQPRLTAWLRKEQDRIAAEKAEAERKAREAQQEAERKAREAEEAAQKPGADALGAAIAAEEAKKRAAEEAKSAATPIRAQAKGDYGTRAASLRTYYSAQIVDVMKALRAFKDHPDVVAALQKAANEAAREAKGDLSKAPSGVVFVAEQRAA